MQHAFLQRSRLCHRDEASVDLAGNDYASERQVSFLPSFSGPSNVPTSRDLVDTLCNTW